MGNSASNSGLPGGSIQGYQTYATRPSTSPIKVSSPKPSSSSKVYPINSSPSNVPLSIKTSNKPSNITPEHVEQCRKIIEQYDATYRGGKRKNGKRRGKTRATRKRKTRA
jgi:hypothetical protein